MKKLGFNEYVMLATLLIEIAQLLLLILDC